MHESDGDSGERRPLPGIGAMRDPRRCALRLLLDALPRRGAEAPDPIERDVTAAHDASYGRYGARKIKAALSRAGITASCRRICRTMGKTAWSAPTGAKGSRVIAAGSTGPTCRTWWR